VQRRKDGERAHVAAIALALACGSAGCARSLDMSKARDATRPTVLIPYTAVHEETRLYPDYGHIGASIVTVDAAPAPARKKKGRSP